MPAPTALRQQPEELTAAINVPLPIESACSFASLVTARIVLLTVLDQDEELLLDTAMELSDVPIACENDTVMVVDEEGKPKFAAQKNIDGPTKIENRKVPIPPHRMSPLKTEWTKVCIY